jgi:hypothetical protein
VSPPGHRRARRRRADGAAQRHRLPGRAGALPRRGARAIASRCPARRLRLVLVSVDAHGGVRAGLRRGWARRGRGLGVSAVCASVRGRGRPCRERHGARGVRREFRLPRWSRGALRRSHARRELRTRVRRRLARRRGHTARRRLRPLCAGWRRRRCATLTMAPLSRRGKSCDVRSAGRAPCMLVAPCVRVAKNVTSRFAARYASMASAMLSGAWRSCPRRHRRRSATTKRHRVLQPSF